MPAERLRTARMSRARVLPDSRCDVDVPSWWELLRPLRASRSSAFGWLLWVRWVDHSGGAVFASLESLLRIWLTAALGESWPARTAPTDEPTMISKFEPEPEYQPSGS